MRSRRQGSLCRGPFERVPPKGMSYRARDVFHDLGMTRAARIPGDNANDTLAAAVSAALFRIAEGSHLIE